MKQKIFVLFMVVLTMFAMAACSDDDSGSSDISSSSSSSDSSSSDSSSSDSSSSGGSEAWTQVGDSGLTSPGTAIDGPGISFLVNPDGSSIIMAVNDSSTGSDEDGPIHALLYQSGAWMKTDVEDTDARKDQRVAVLGSDLYVAYRQDNKNAGLKIFNTGSWEKVEDSSGDDIDNFMDGNLPMDNSDGKEWNDPAVTFFDDNLYIAAQADDNDYVQLIKYDGTDFSVVAPSGATNGYVNEGNPVNKATEIEIDSDEDTGNIYIAFDSNDGDGDLTVYKWDGSSYTDLGFATDATNTEEIDDIALTAFSGIVVVGYSDKANAPAEDGPFELYSYDGSWSHLGTVADDTKSDLSLVPTTEAIYCGYRTADGKLGVKTFDDPGFTDLSSEGGFPNVAVNDPALSYAYTEEALYVAFSDEDDSYNLKVYKYKK